VVFMVSGNPSGPLRVQESAPVGLQGGTHAAGTFHRRILRHSAGREV